MTHKPADDMPTPDTPDTAVVGPLGRIYTISEAAKALGMARSSIEQLIIRHPFFTKNGNRKLFSDEDIRALWVADRRPVPTVPDSSSDIFASLLAQERKKKAEKQALRRQQMKR